MKQLSGPYKEFESYYPLEDTIELYMEIWYESSSSDEEWVRILGARIQTTRGPIEKVEVQEAYPADHLQRT